MIRCPRHLAFVRGLPCLACGVSPDHGAIQAAHIRVGPGSGKGGIGLKPGDDRVVPLCADCHRRQHDHGEPAFWSGLDIGDPLGLAARLFAATGDRTAARRLVFDRHFR